MIRRTIAWLGVQGHRGYIYRVVGVIGTAAFAAGFITNGELQTILTDAGLVLSVGGNGLSAVHSPTPRARARRRRSTRKARS